VKRYRPAGEPERPNRARDYALAACGRAGIEQIVEPDPDLTSVIRESNVQDSTGAGDAMAAGIQLALLRDLSLQDGLDLAFVLAMAVSERVGARAGQPDISGLAERWGTWFSRPCPV